MDLTLTSKFCIIKNMIKLELYTTTGFQTPLYSKLILFAARSSPYQYWNDWFDEFIVEYGGERVDDSIIFRNPENATLFILKFS